MNFNEACTLKLNFWIIEFKMASFTTVFMAATDDDYVDFYFGAFRFTNKTSVVCVMCRHNFTSSVRCTSHSYEHFRSSLQEPRISCAKIAKFL